MRGRASERLPQQLDDRAIRDPDLGAMRTGTDDGAAPRSDSVRDRIEEACLADPGLALHDRDTGRIGGDNGQESVEFRIPADERDGRARSRCLEQRLDRPWYLRRRDGREPAVADRLIGGRRLRERRDPELAIEDGDTHPVLPDGARPVARTRVRQHREPVGILVERIQLQPTGEDPSNAGGVASAFQVLREPRQQETHRTFHRGCTGGAPVVERDAIAQAESGQKRAARDVCRIFELPDRGARRSRLEGDEVDIRVGAESDGRAVHLEPAIPERLAQHG